MGQTYIIQKLGKEFESSQMPYGGIPSSVNARRGNYYSITNLFLLVMAALLVGVSGSLDPLKRWYPREQDLLSTVRDLARNPSKLYEECEEDISWKENGLCLSEPICSDLPLSSCWLSARAIISVLRKKYALLDYGWTPNIRDFNELAGLDNPSIHFFQTTGQYALQGVPNRKYKGHTFVIVHLDERFYLFQSYINNHTLAYYMENHVRPYDRREMTAFVDRVYSLQLERSGPFSAKFDQLYTELFKSASGLRNQRLNGSRFEFEQILFF